MLSQKSIRTRFVLQLAPASAALIVVFSIILYSTIKISILSNINNELLQEAKKITEKQAFDANPQENLSNLKSHDWYNAKFEIVVKQSGKRTIAFEKTSEHKKHFLSVYYPYKLQESLYLKLTYDVTYINALLDKILFSIFLMNCSMIFIVIFYAFFLSSTLLLPIKALNYKLANMNESFLKPIDIKSFPHEFLPLGKSVNRLIGKIQTFVRYQKEFFIGIAHELKTPLAVMKTKNEVTLIKKRDNQVYIEALQKNIAKIDEMNKMISAILEIGRQEGAQFEESVKIDLIKFIKNKTDDFKIIAANKQSNKHLHLELNPKSYKITVQPTLIAHILQNFVQNAFKFGKENSNIIVRSCLTQNGFIVEVLSESDDIDESKDFFAPFKRFGDKGGAGLGLFLAKSAADAIGATISLKNRMDGIKGVIASLFIPSHQKIR